MKQLHLRRTLVLSACLAGTLVLTACGSIGLRDDIQNPLGFDGDRDRWHGDRPHWDDRGHHRHHDQSWDRDADWRWDRWDRGWHRHRDWDDS